MASETSDKKDIWSANTYGTTVAPFVAALTGKVVEWLDPQPQGRLLGFRGRGIQPQLISLPCR